MTHEVNDEIGDTILQAEENILRIAEELGRMKTASDQLDEAGKRFCCYRSQLSVWYLRSEPWWS